RVRIPASGTLIFLEGGLRGTLIKRVERIWDGFFLGGWVDGPLKRKGMGTDFLEGVLGVCADFFEGG
ncbi:MAG: hypothetical protein WBP43_15045, partial [Chitinophagales bacterium]